VGFLDHRTLIGLGSSRGREALRQALGSRIESTDDPRTRVDDVLALEPGGLVIRVTETGTVRDGGIADERQRIQLWTFGADGLLAQCEWFDPDRRAEALARFHDFTAVVAPPAPASRAMIANDATAFGARVDAAVALRDSDAMGALIAASAQIIDHKTGTTFDREERIAGLRALLIGAREPVSRHEPLAALGSSLALLRRTLAASGFGGEAPSPAAYRIEELCVVEADRQARCVWADLFAVDRLGDAIVRLYERHAEMLAEGPARTRAAAIARSVAIALGPPDPDLLRPALALDVRYTDHRALGWGTAHGVVAFVRALSTLRDALPEAEAHTIEVLALRADALLVRRTVAGELNAGGDRYRRRPIVLWVFGANGRVTHWEQFDGEQREQAHARFGELEAPPARETLLESAASRSSDQFDRAWAAHDWPALAALHAAGFHYSDRRKGIRLEQDRETFLASARPLFDGRAAPASREVLATRGDRLALIALRFAAAAGATAPAERLLAIEVNARGERIAVVRFDPGDRNAGHTELDARYAAGEATAHPAMWAALWDVRRAFAAHDWDRLASLVSADFVAEDHRLLGWGTARSAEEYAAAVRPVTELRPDVSLRLDHLVLAQRTALFVASWIGGEGAASFEIPVVIVFRANTDGRIDRVHHYNVEQIAEARACFAKLGAEPPRDPLVALVEPNAATAAMDRVLAAFESGNWAALRAQCAPEMMSDDRRRHVQWAVDLDQWIADWRDARAQGMRVERRALATEGDRVALEGVMWSGSGERAHIADSGRFEIEYLWLIEVDERGRIGSCITFDLQDEPAARSEAQRRA
jgi:hypothetical protein